MKPTCQLRWKKITACPVGIPVEINDNDPMFDLKLSSFGFLNYQGKRKNGAISRRMSERKK